MSCKPVLLAAASATGLLVASAALALDTGVTYIGADQTRTLLGDGTGVIVGVIDSGVDDTHPGLAGPDSLGRPRLVAEANFVPSEPANTGDDVFGHGTEVMGVIGGRDATYAGLATDARYVNARVLDSGNGFASTTQVINGAGFALDSGADVLNLSLNTSGEFSNGQLGLDRMLDWAAVNRGVLSAVCGGNIGQATGGDPSVRSPGGAFNVLTVGRSTADFSRVHPDSAVGPTSDGRSKPDVIAPGTSITTFSDDWETGGLYRTVSGCSFATPHVAGLLAQQVDYGRANGLSVDPRVLKATVMNSADKILGKNGQAWTPGASSTNGGVLQITRPLDDQQGAGQIDALALYGQYSAGEHEAGLIPALGWDFNTIVGENDVDYVFSSPLAEGSTLTATLSWLRDITRTDDGDGVIDAGDTFGLGDALDNLDLMLLLDDAPLAISMSDVDSIEHLSFTLPQTGLYTLRVSRQFVLGSGPDEAYALAWAATAVPEPGTAAVTCVAGLLLLRRRRRCGA